MTDQEQDDFRDRICNLPNDELKKMYDACYVAKRYVEWSLLYLEGNSRGVDLYTYGWKRCATCDGCGKVPLQ